MTPKQRYLFDLTGYIHLKNVLSDGELKNAQDPEVMERLSPETIELVQPASYTHIKEIVKSEYIQLT